VSVAALRIDDYESFCEGVRQLSRIDLLQYKRGQMERRVRSFAERKGERDLRSYLGRLAADPAELDAFLDRVTINVSQLWRNPELWRRIEGEIVPELAAGGRLRAWSAGCSYGAEAYTLAAVSRQAAPGARVEIRGSDIDARMVARAREGRFSVEDARSAPAAALARWFEREPDGYRAVPELRRLVRFETGDLLRDRFAARAYDLVLCRNVVIYFTEPVRDALHRRLAEAVRPGGYLVIGSSERVTNPQAIGLRAVYPFVYRRVA
jgi:chemotaxis protein methyltransferase CheR